MNAGDGRPAPLAAGGGAMPAGPRRVVIMGAAGRDFHDFNVCCRRNPAVRVVAFTAAQIPGIAGRRYPPSLAGALYPDGIPIVPESELVALIRRERVQEVWFAYSDLPHVEVMHRASTVLAAGASFSLPGPAATMLRASVPVVAVGAARTGAGKSPLSRHLVAWLHGRGHRVVAIRHPMPYGQLARQAVQRFATPADLDAAEATIEEREEYEPYLGMGAVVFAGVDYAAILAAAEREADVIVWDGGNNDFPFIRPDLYLVVLDPHRAGDELTYHPGETNLRLADLFVVTKVATAPPGGVERVLANARSVRPEAPVVLADLAVTAEPADLIRGRRVVVVEDGPTLTHGGLALGAGSVAAARFGAAEVVDARPYAVGAIAETFRAFPHLTGEVPAMGYSPQQIRDLQATLQRVPADVVVDASPIDLAHLLQPDKPIVRVSYAFQAHGDTLDGSLAAFERRYLPARRAATGPAGPG